MQDARRRLLDRDLLERALLELGVADIVLDVRNQVTSTNDEVARLGSQWALCTADEQVAGRGRLGRQWVSPQAAGVAMSVWLPLTQVRCAISALPLVVGLAVVEVLAECGAAATLKWPNDIMLHDRKLGGILSQLHPEGAVVGIGINTHLSLAELPTTSATSLMAVGISVVREQLIAGVVAAVRRKVADGEGRWHAEYLEQCATLGRTVRVELADGQHVVGPCIGVTPEGALVLGTNTGSIAINVGDVHHLRDGNDSDFVTRE